ncbi:Protein GUCD1 [Cryptotermes secundus]|uniref:Protein GUCD1 n=1 Tax=Cryptotermes secundus TaxID=105785 RepID=A0A2J7R7X7_9NEOP|nr:protein GUCD1 [Cryptotermes secundus]PNF36938.1 Protein GUCD1 [Cryptotermes secundus]
MEVTKYTDKGTYPRLELQLTHHRQRYNWDCGVSCVLMVLEPKTREHLLLNFKEICKEEGFNESTWSIDLCYLLKRYGVSHLYCTITLGIHPSHRGQSFYDKVLQKDEERVTRRFLNAAERGITVRKASLTCKDLVRHLSESGPIILLTNAALLCCDICKENRLASELRGCLPWGTAYTGHYIVLCGYNLSSEKFLYHNPSFKNRVCMMSFAKLDEARCSYGTDEDAILVYFKSWT